MIKKTIFLIAVVILTGCASPAMQQSMSIGIQDIPSKLNSDLKGQVNVRNIGGGKETNPLLASQVNNQAFKGALEQSLIAVGYKSQKTADAKYQVDAVLQNLDQPMFGFTFDVKSTVLYTVSTEGVQKIFPVTAVGTATTSDAFAGIERLRIANERSIKENIKQFIQNISLNFSK